MIKIMIKKFILKLEKTIIKITSYDMVKSKLYHSLYSSEFLDSIQDDDKKL
jgi:hypothetical protein